MRDERPPDRFLASRKTREAFARDLVESAGNPSAYNKVLGYLEVLAFLRDNDLSAKELAAFIVEPLRH